MHIISSELPKYTPPIGRRFHGHSSDFSRFQVTRSSPADIVTGQSTFVEEFDSVPKDIHRNGIKYQRSISEDEGLELSDEFTSAKYDDGHDCFSQCCRRVIINVSGLRFETQLKTLNRLPNTLLGNPHLRKRYWDAKRNEYFFDRHRPSFQAILYYYQSGGRLKCPYEVPMDIFVEELEFFGLEQEFIDSYKLSEGYIVEKERDLPTNKVLKFLWELLEFPDSSIGARSLAVVSVFFIAVSIVTLCLETVPELASNYCLNTSIQTTNSSKSQIKVFINYTNHFFILETLCVLWFSLELVLRFIACPSKVQFLKNLLNWIDVASILPHLVFVGVYCVSGLCLDSGASEALSVLRILRITRVFKLTKHSSGLQIFGETLKNSTQELAMFLLFMGIGVVVFSAAIYHSEQFMEDSHFTSIPGAFWWSIVSMTTVGYGDMYPIGIPGKLVGTFAVITGILTVALPVPIIVNNFNALYSVSKGRL